MKDIEPKATKVHATPILNGYPVKIGDTWIDSHGQFREISDIFWLNDGPIAIVKNSRNKFNLTDGVCMGYASYRLKERVREAEIEAPKKGIISRLFSFFSLSIGDPK